MYFIMTVVVYCCTIQIYLEHKCRGKYSLRVDNLKTDPLIPII